MAFCFEKNALSTDTIGKRTALSLVQNNRYSLSSIVYYYFSAISQEVLGYICGFVLMFTAFLYLGIHFGCAKGITSEDLEE